MGVWPWGAQVRRTVGWSMKPLCTMKTLVRRSRQAFFEPGPHGRRPLSNGHFVAFAAASSRLLWAPLAAPEQAPEARGTIGNAKMVFNEGHHPLESPEFVMPAMGARPLA